MVINRTARYLDSPADAGACIAGYALSHDVSEREYQLERGGQWDKGKSCETFNPFGPDLVLAESQSPRTFPCGCGSTERCGKTEPPRA